MKKNWWVILLIVLLVGCLCCCGTVIAAGLVFAASDVSSGLPGWMGETQIPFPIEGVAPPSDRAIAMLQALASVDVPENDPRDLAMRLRGLTQIREVIPALDYQVGDLETFWASNMDTDANFQVTARLAAASDHAYVWIEEGVEYVEEDLHSLITTFESQIYPTNREFFGSEFTPGIDGDVHIYLVYAGGLGSNIAGYFSANDSLPPEVYPYSNAHETFFFNSDVLKLGGQYTLSTLAHEFQHMIHWNQDRNESSWVNEGFSELATVLNGYSPGGFDLLYLMEPDVQLNVWPVDPAAQSVHYGSSFLFMQYFLSRFGETATQALVANPLNDMAAIDAVLSDLDVRHPETDELLRAEDVFADWAVANVVNDSTVADGQYGYSGYVPTVLDIAFLQERLRNCTTAAWAEGNVTQFGVDRIDIACHGVYQLEFEGVGEVGLLPVNAYSGDWMFWSNKGSESDMTLTRTIDLREVTAPVMLEYTMWFDLEEDYDYVYLLVSQDGESWEFLETPHGTGDNPVGSNLGWGYTGSSEGWIKETVDLSAFAGELVMVRFEYVTDANLNGEGFLLDDVNLDAVGYQADFEDGDGGWLSEGFVRVENRLAQSYVLSIIYQDAERTEVDTFFFDGGVLEEFVLRNDAIWDRITVLVSGTTRYTEQPAVYRLRVVELE